MSERSCELRVRVAPRSSQNRIELRSGDHLKVRLTAPPVDGQANAALSDLLAKALGLPKSAVEIVSGRNSRDKLLRIHGIDSFELWALLGQPKLMED